MKEQEKLAIIIRYSNGVITGNEAARQLRLALGQVQRKKKAYLTEGMLSIIYKSKGKITNRGFGKEFADKILYIYKNEYPGWNFCHFGDVLEDDYGIFISDSYICNLLTANGRYD